MLFRSDRRQGLVLALDLHLFLGLDGLVQAVAPAPEMTRQRIRPSLRRSVYEDCPCCTGTGQVKTAESMAIDVMRLLMTHANREEVSRVTVDVHERVAAFLNNRKRRDITNLEEVYEVTINVHALTAVGPEHLQFHCTNETGSEVKILAQPDSKSKG